MPKKILITGAQGQLGRAIAHQAIHSTCELVFTDADSLDITDSIAVEEALMRQSFDAVVNCAAYTQVDAAEEHQQQADRLNHLAAKILANACYKHRCTLIHISTDYVFSGEKNTPYNETDLTQPNTVYGATKRLGEEAIIQSGCSHIIIRTAWLYSPWGNNFAKTMLRLAEHKGQINVVFDQVGTPTYAGDLAAFILHIIDTNQLHKQGIYHFSNEGVCSWYDFARKIVPSSCKINPCLSSQFSQKAPRPHYSVLNKELAKSSFGVTIPHWEESLELCLKEMEALNTSTE